MTSLDILEQQEEDAKAKAAKKKAKKAGKAKAGKGKGKKLTEEEEYMKDKRVSQVPEMVTELEDS